MDTDSAAKKSLLAWIPAAAPSDDAMDVESSVNSKTGAPEPVPEADIYFRLLMLHHLLSSPSTYGKAVELAQQTVEKMQALNRRSMDPIASKIWFAVERAYELGGELADARPYELSSKASEPLIHLIVMP